MDLLYKEMSKSLNLKENSFSAQFGERALMHARFNFYPRCSKPDLVLGVKPHTDRSGITILLQDKQVEGLQILVDEKWVRVPLIPDALVVNLGDQMQIMSNGIFRSPMHRVVTNSESLRLSAALFHEPEPEKEIGPVDSLMDEYRPRLYRNVKNYGVIIECYKNGLAVGHRVESSFLDKVREITKRFFALLMEEKHKYDREANSLEGISMIEKLTVFKDMETI
ncbi:probable 2-oxoglutarate/Fe(II)-dependent dioxygenase [Jatropha curcas]|uniref:probable 2-oxoglutarate/Fe(II)-dependent dioxygenase n=1 Tax=Jatropha curcas TaxID=180498 RepID=UPI001894E832|nr:probable 2-oxoglutarate/Fe(II)-dependent dioxygenase [Jatropha curcas]